MRKQNVVKLSETERTELEGLVTKGKAGARVIRRAHSLLLSDTGKTDKGIAELLHIDELTVARTRKQWVASHTLTDRPRRGRQRKLDGKQAALLVALACSEAPEGRTEWTMQLLADKIVALGVVDSAVSDETVRRTLKKMTSSPGKKSNGVLPK